MEDVVPTCGRLVNFPTSLVFPPGEVSIPPLKETGLMELDLVIKKGRKPELDFVIKKDP